MDSNKIIFIGPVGAGKTTAINAISDIACVNTEAQISGHAPIHKDMTTVAIDYGRLTSAQGTKTHLYGAPGQSRFDFIWDMLSDQIAHDAQAVVLMLDNARECPQEDLKYYVNAFSRLICGKSLILGITRCDIQGSPDLECYRGWLDELGIEAQVHRVDARSREAVMTMLSPVLDPMRAGQKTEQGDTDMRSGDSASPRVTALV